MSARRDRVVTRGLLAALLAVAACAEGAPGSAPGSPPTARPAPSSSPAPPSPQGSEDVKVREFVGLSGGEITTAMGRAPGFRRREGRAEMWRYSGQACLLDLFFYPEGGTQRVAHAEIRRREGASGLSEADCLDDVLSGRGSS